MANIASIPLVLTIVGDGASLTASVALASVPTSVSLVKAYSSTGTDVSSNIVSVVISGYNLVFTFTAAFTGPITVSLNLGNAATTSPANGIVVLRTYSPTAPTLVAGQAAAAQCDSVGSHYVNTEGRKATYHMAVRSFTPVASATSPLFSIQGSATKTIRVTHLRITWSATTGATSTNDISLQKFSVLSGGTVGNTPVGAKNDSANPAQTAVCLQYSAVPTTATVIGGISIAERMGWVSAGTTTAQTQAIDWPYGNLNDQSLVLRGTSEFFGVVVSAVGGTPLMDIWIEFTEE